MRACYLGNHLNQVWKSRENNKKICSIPGQGLRTTNTIMKDLGSSQIIAILQINKQNFIYEIDHTQ